MRESRDRSGMGPTSGKNAGTCRRTPRQYGESFDVNSGGIAVALTKHMKTLLAALLSQARRLEALPKPVTGSRDRGRFFDQWRERTEYEQFGIRHDLASWLGHVPTPAESAVFSRTLRDMELAGLVLRVSRWGRRRATHVRLSPLGRAEARPRRGSAACPAPLGRRTRVPAPRRRASSASRRPCSRRGPSRRRSSR